jgi:hypothetical protein
MTRLASALEARNVALPDTAQRFSPMVHLLSEPLFRSLMRPFSKIGRIAFFQKMPARKHLSDFRKRRLRRDVVRAASKGNTVTANDD